MPEPLARLRTGTTLYELEDERTTIGRDASNDLVIDAKGVSRVHAVLSIGPDATVRRAVLFDEGSSNGTFVNGQRLVPKDAFPLNHGDLIFFSAYEKTSYRFEIPGMEVAPLPNMILPPAKVPLITGGGRDIGRRSPSRFDRHPTPLDPIEAPLRQVGSYAFQPKSPIFRNTDLPVPTPMRKNDALNGGTQSPRPASERPRWKSGPLHARIRSPSSPKSSHASVTSPDATKNVPRSNQPVRASSSSMRRESLERSSPSSKAQAAEDDARGWESAIKPWDSLPDADVRLLEQSFMCIRDCACQLSKVPDTEARVPTCLTDFPLAFHRLARRVEEKVLRKRRDDAAQTDDVVVEPREVHELKDTLETQTAELQELRRQIAFFHNFFPQAISEDSLKTRLVKSRDAISSGQLTPKDAQELLEVLMLAQKGLQEQDRRQEVCQRRWRQLLEDLSAAKAENQSQRKLIAAQQERYKEALEACDSTVRSCRQQLEALCDGVTQDALRTVNAQLDKLEQERRALAEKVDKALIEKDKWEYKSKAEVLRRENAEQLYRQAEMLSDKLEELQKSTAPERAAHLEALVCSLEHKLSQKILSTEVERTAEADWRTFAIQARQDARRLQVDNVELRKALEHAQSFQCDRTSPAQQERPVPRDAPAPPPILAAAGDSVAFELSALPSCSGNVASAGRSPPGRMDGAPSADWPSDHARTWQAVPGVTALPQEKKWAPRPTASDFWSEDPVHAYPRPATNPEAVDLELPHFSPVKQVVVELPDDEMSVECY